MGDAWRKNVPDFFVKSVEAMSTEELKNVILQSTDMIAKTKKERKADPRLNALKEDVKELNGGYNDNIKAYEAKVNLALEILEQRGVSV